jgi:hypothetical protein
LKRFSRREPLNADSSEGQRFAVRAHFRRFRGLQEIGWAVPHHVRSSVQLYEYPYIFFDCNGANLLGPTVLQNARHENQQPPQAVTFCEVRIGNDVGQKWDAYFYRNNAVDARNYFNPAPEPVSVLLLNQFGASLGGAFIKKKWFYFVNYEGVRDRVGNPNLADSRSARLWMLRSSKSESMRARISNSPP